MQDAPVSYIIGDDGKDEAVVEYTIFDNGIGVNKRIGMGLVFSEIPFSELGSGIRVALVSLQ
jgi:hypothetical protein